MDNKNTICVRGTSKINVPPDFVNINITVTVRKKDYSECMGTIIHNVAELQDILGGINIARDEIKTCDFEVETKYHYDDDSKKRCFDGYEITQELRIGFDFTSARLNEVLTALSSVPSHPEFRLRFTVKDPTAVRDQLFANITANARAVATALCSGLGVKLGEIISINYSWTEIDFYSDFSLEGGGLRNLAPSIRRPSFTPDDITASDSANFTFAIIQPK